MKIIKADNKQYIRLGDLDHLLLCMSADVYDKYDRDENGNYIGKDGTKGLTPEDQAKVSTIAGVMSGILRERLQACESQEEVEELYERIRNEFYMDKYVVVTSDEDDSGKKQTYLFRKYCKDAMAARMREEGKSEEEIRKEMEDEDSLGDPVFSSVIRDADFFEDHEFADGTAQHIAKNWNIDVKVQPAWYFNAPAVRKALDWLLKDPEEDEEEEGEGNG